MEDEGDGGGITDEGGDDEGGDDEGGGIETVALAATTLMDNFWPFEQCVPTVQTK